VGGASSSVAGTADLLKSKMTSLANWCFHYCTHFNQSMFSLHFHRWIQ